MNKQTEYLNTILSVYILIVLAPPAKKMSYTKIANKQDQFKQKQSFKREKEHEQRFILGYFKLFIAGKVAVPLRPQ